MASNDLVERYVAAVKFWLPEKLREDIGAELADDIHSEIDEAEKAKGRPLSEDDVAAILKARGKPMSVAARYQPQRHLIGPELFPLYIFVLKIVAAICLAPAVLSWIFHPVGAAFSGAFPSLVDSLLTAFAIVTIVFALIEHKGIDIGKKTDWNPKTLRPVVDKNRIPRSDSVADIIGALIGIGIFIAGYLSQTTYHFPSGGGITLAPEWIPFWQIMIGLAVASLALAAVNLFKPYWSGPRVVAQLILSLSEAAAFYWLFRSHLVRAVSGVPDHVAAQFLTLSDKAAELTLPVFGFVAAIIVAQAVRRLVRALKPRPATA
jgi:hypothetical protein